MEWKDRAHRAALVCTVSAVLALAGVLSRAQGPGGTVRYQDPQGRFRFEYPAAFGAPQRGTNDGFGDRLAAVRFTGLAGLGGEAVLTRGPLVLDMQALGGLYDPIALEALPELTRRTVLAQRMRVDIDTLCRALGTDQHLGTFAGSSQVLAAIVALERIRNVDPRVVRCDVTGDRVVFHKEATFEAGAISTRQHIIGAVRYLTGGEASAFHIVRVLPSAPSAAQLAELDALVRSFTR